MDDDRDNDDLECKCSYPISLRLLLKCLQCATCYFFWDDHKSSWLREEIFKKLPYKNFVMLIVSDLFAIFSTTLTLCLLATVSRSCSSALWRRADYLFTSFCVTGFTILFSLNLTWFLPYSYDSIVHATIAMESPQTLFTILVLFLTDNRLSARDLSKRVNFSKHSRKSSQIRV